MPTVSHRPDPIARLWKFKLHHYRLEALVAIGGVGAIRYFVHIFPAFYPK
ncbi:MAG: hypothetical protein WBM24_16770 [Candidatus Sulfotelmatobacter sp.]